MAILALAAPALAQSETPAPVPTPYSKECQTGTTNIATSSPLPNVTEALRKRKTIRILAIGASVFAGRRGTYMELIEQLLEGAIRGLDVVVINRGVSGELAADAATRIRDEVALNEPDLVLWQVGTNDALAFVPVDEFAQSVTDTLHWLKEHKVDVLLVGLQYAARMSRDAHYREIRDRLRAIAAKENVIIIRYDEAMRIVAQAESERLKFTPGEFPQTDAGYNCLAEYVARAITLGLYGRGLRPRQLPGQRPPSEPAPPGPPPELAPPAPK